jgi:hypothetical protein
VRLPVKIPGPLVKAAETVGVFARRRPSIRTLLANRAQTPTALHGILPSTVAAGEDVSLTVQVWDQCERLVDDFAGEIQLDATDGAATLPTAVDIEADDGGVVSVGDITFGTPGIQYVTLHHPSTGTFVANPVRVTADPPDERLYWGDIHLHSQFSDGASGVKSGLQFGRDVMDLDVVAYTDHDTMGFFIPPSWQRRRMHDAYFDRMKDLAREFHDPGEFVTLFGYEWTKQPNVGGHVNVYFDSVEEAELFDSLTAGTDTYEGLWDTLRDWNADGAGEAITVPHHPAEAMYPFDFATTDYDDELAPLVEVYSQWGSSERPASAGNDRPVAMGQGEIDEPGHYVQDALALGHRVGLVSSSDYHGPHPGHSLIHTSPHLPSVREWREGGLGWGLIWRIWNERSYPGGLQAFRAPELTREAVFDAFRSRAVYGTTQPHRIIVDFAIDGVRVGEQDSRVELPSAEAERDIAVTVAGTAPLSTVEIVKNNASWRTATPAADDDARPAGELTHPPTPVDTPLDDLHGSLTLDRVWTDDRSVTGLQWDADRGTDDDVYYCRVRQADGGMAWAGPLWVGTGDG